MTGRGARSISRARPSPGRRRLIAVAFVAALALAYAAAKAAGWTHVSIVDAGTAEVDLRTFPAHELSGLTWAGPIEGKPGAHRYYAVSDGSRDLYTLEVVLKPDSGGVASCAVVSTQKLAAGGDLEGVAVNSEAGTVFVCDESGSVVREHRLSDGEGHKAGDVANESALPPPFTKPQGNLGVESLGRDADSGALWTANEEALSGDGDKSSTEAGSVVRLVKLGPDLKPSAQRAYRTDAISDNLPKNASRERCGVVDIAPLPDGTLLVLERMLDVERFIFADIPHFRSRVYHVDLTGATDVSGFTAGLQGREYKPVSKRLLWEGKFSVEKPCSFEGMALGPELGGGGFSLLLISDDENGALMGRIQALRLEVKKTLQPPAR